ncbi:HNH endonuclease [Candidatus Babeliales bacterium]|nr:HNH endonuclease [Candidatus Babeliales bacterium]
MRNKKGQFIKECIPWNKGRKIKTNTGRTHFKKEHKSWITGKKLPPFSKEWKKKMSKSHKGKKHSKETKEKISNSHKGKKLSKEHKKKLSEAHKGQIVWNKGISKYSSKIKRFRNSNEYKKWRIKIYNRDNFTCQVCGQVGKKLHAHHIKSVAKYFELRLDINNGITLCDECHKEIHKL